MSQKDGIDGPKYLTGIVSFGTRTCGKVRNLSYIRKKSLPILSFCFSGLSGCLYKCYLLPKLDCISHASMIVPNSKFSE